jgi:HEAT repeat protein
MTRLYLAAFLGVVSLTSQSAWAQAEKKETKPITDVGGKTLDQWIKEIDSTDPSKRDVAIKTILVFGPDAQKALPKLIAELKRGSLTSPIDVSVRLSIATSLGMLLGDKSIPPKVQADAIVELKRLLKDTQTIIRYRAAEAVAKLGPEAKSAIPELIAMTKEFASWESRHVAAGALGQVGVDRKSGPPKEVVSALLPLLGDYSHQVRMMALQSLANLGAPADTTLKQRLETIAAKDSEPVVQVTAHFAYIALTNDPSPPHLAGLAKHLRDSEPTVRSQAAQAIGMIGDRAKTVLSSLAPLASDPNPTVQLVGVWALGRMGKEAAAVLPALEKLAGDANADPQVKIAAKAAVESIKGGGKK